MLTRELKANGKISDALGNAGCVIAAVSGGADSVALLLALYEAKDEFGFTLKACHINHCLRGEESDRDERFVRTLCKRLDLPLYVRKVKVGRLVRQHESIEECARRVRYEFFDELNALYGGLTATAHTASDNAETVLINMLRGTALTGICGIPAVRDNIIRPLIGCTREQTERFCAEMLTGYVHDSTNDSDDYVRNRIRHRIIPELKAINPSFESAVARLCESVTHDDEYLESAAVAAKMDCVLDDGYSVKKLAVLPESVLRRVAAMIMRENDIKVNARALGDVIKIIKAGQGKTNPQQYKFVRIRRKKLFVETNYEKYRKI
ncbi:MAG: tRNA lysidine(34) synthetase TilS [Eubacterium sp.]|nr:tRNA lysidine(34) synthetase TilS [Eubacterium sp.]